MQINFKLFGFLFSLVALGATSANCHSQSINSPGLSVIEMQENLPGVVICAKENAPSMYALIKNRDEIINSQIPATWHVRNDLDQYVGIELLQKGRAVARLVMPPSLNLTRNIPGYGFEYRLFQAKDNCVNFNRAKILESGILNKYNGFYKYRRIDEKTMYTNGVFTSLISDLRNRHTVTPYMVNEFTMTE